MSRQEQINTIADEILNDTPGLGRSAGQLDPDNPYGKLLVGIARRLALKILHVQELARLASKNLQDIEDDTLTATDTNFPPIDKEKGAVVALKRTVEIIADAYLDAEQDQAREDEEPRWYLACDNHTPTPFDSLTDVYEHLRQHAGYVADGKVVAPLLVTLKERRSDGTLQTVDAFDLTRFMD